MRTMFRESGFAVRIQVLLVVLVVGFFVAACEDGPLSTCGKGGAYCHNSGLCCPDTSPYYCANKLGATTEDGCFSSNCGSRCCDVQFEKCT